MSRAITVHFRPIMLLLILFTVAAFGWTARASAAGPYVGHVFTESNAVSGNAVLVYGRTADGSLTALGSIPTHGNGTGAGLGSQGALARSGKWLLAVNGGSNDISVIDPSTRRVAAVVDSGGSQPISLAVHGNLVYVLNAGGSGSISGFRLNPEGELRPIPNSTRPLGGSAPAEIQFSPDGQVLVVTEKGTSTMDTYRVDSEGTTSGPTSYPSSGTTPFGFAFTRNNILVVSEAAVSAASSYRVSSRGAVSLISGSVVNGQQAACWVAITQSGRYAYTADAHNGMISSYGVGGDGSLTLLDGTAGAPGGGPLDEAITGNDKFLYVLNPANGAINGFSIAPDGHLSALPNAGGIPASAAGLVAR